MEPTTADIIKCVIYLIIGIFFIIRCVHEAPLTMSDEWIDRNIYKIK